MNEGRNTRSECDGKLLQLSGSIDLQRGNVMPSLVSPLLYSSRGGWLPSLSWIELPLRTGHSSLHQGRCLLFCCIATKIITLTVSCLLCLHSSCMIFYFLHQTMVLKVQCMYCHNIKTYSLETL